MQFKIYSDVNTKLLNILKKENLSFNDLQKELKNLEDGYGDSVYSHLLYTDCPEDQ